MSDATRTQRRALLARIEGLAATEPSFAAFFRHVVGATDEQDLLPFSLDGYEAVLRQSYQRLGRREPGAHDVRIWSPHGTEGARVQIVDVYVDDMPFLVDSVLGAIRAHGGTIQAFSHPLLPIDLSVTPRVVRPVGGPGIAIESFLQVHIDPITDETMLLALGAELDGVLTEVRRAVRGWRPMLERLRVLVGSFRQHPPDVAAPVLAETLHFLAWLADHNFTFLGMREYRLTGTGDTTLLAPVEGSGLGILEDPDFHFLRRGTDYVEMTAQHVDFLRTPDPLMVTKANVRARVHRRAHMDYIGVKIYDAEGELTGELRTVGLFTSMSLATPHTEVPLIRRKISEVMRRSRLDPGSHAGKALMAALDNYPRDELFQIAEDQLYEFATEIAGLPDRPQVRVLPRIDRFDNFVSILVYLPRDRYASGVRAQIGNHLARRYDGRVSAYFPHFPEGDLVRVHFIIGRNGGPTPRPARDELEDEVAALTRTFGDRLMAAVSSPSAIAGYWDAFSEAYQATHSHAEALDDIGVMKTLRPDAPLAVRLIPHHRGDAPLRLRVYHLGAPIPLSDRVPLLENFGFRVIDEDSYTIAPRGQEERALHDMALVAADGAIIDPGTHAPRLEPALLAVWGGAAESDGFNQLTVKAGLQWHEVTVLRAYGRYLKQIGTAWSQTYMWTALGAHPAVARDLVGLFHALNDSAGPGDADPDALRAAIAGALEEIAAIDEDQIIRHFLNLIEATLRTNHYQRDAGSPSGTAAEEGAARRPALALKFDSARVESLPEPRPYREIFVYSPRVEGVHLRGGAIARGGLRWSDRPEDFRTEVLGLAKAQMVKNAVIVPVGAKGGFVPKLMPQNPDRETYLAEGTATYEIFVGALLDVTDNLDGDTVIPPDGVVRRDGDDPYLVVAADKGTATFSDTANAISEARDFWLGDAFASGGSAGYDHKKMGITARGAWEAVKRHFREMDRDIQEEDFTVAGVGDMSGDVFGNAMLLSERIRLVAAFDHRDIFIDPDPDPQTSFAERKRLFELPRSSWQDYDTAQLSQGGMVVSRRQKSIQLSPEAAHALDLPASAVTPQQVMTAILRADVDLMWFGGIGTYVRSAEESDAEVGDRANDALRITARQLRAKVVGEGANLAVTQRGRIAYALAGGRINTDAIDNSAGVNSSDLEVNIKIALASLARTGAMTRVERNDLLVEMTDEVAALCLRNNYLQSLSLSLTERRGIDPLPDHLAFMQALEATGALDRAIEYLPDDLGLAERAGAGKPLTRPELAVLLAYAKTTLYDDLLASGVPDDPYLAKELHRYFPDTLTDRYPEIVEGHRLRREVIATVLSNAMINRCGPAFVNRMAAATGADAARIAFAYAAARDSYDLTALNAEIDALDNRVRGGTQLDLYLEVQTLHVAQTLWFLRNVDVTSGLSAIVERYRAGIGTVRDRLGELMTPFITESVAAQAQGFVEGGAPTAVAGRIAELSALTLASDAVLVAERAGVGVDEGAQAYFAVLGRFGLGRVTEQGTRLSLSDRYDRMALDRALANVMRAQRELTIDMLASGSGPIGARLDAWHAGRREEIDRIVGMVADLVSGELTVSRLSVAAGLLSDLTKG